MEADHRPRPAPVIRFSPTSLDDLRRHGEADWPRESCGVLLGRAAGGDREVTRALPCRNAHPEPEHRYQLDPAELLAAVRSARAGGEEVVGFYHSHPHGPARPTATDLREAWWTGCAYAVTDLSGGRAAETRSFVLLGEGEERRFREEPVVALRAGAGGARLSPGPPPPGRP
jgi:proteasome lid subunit RPN8/RPN11